MEQILKKVLLRKLKELDSVKYEGLKLDKHSFESGYSNGFVNGFYVMNKWIIGIIIALATSLIFNLIQY